FLTLSVVFFLVRQSPCLNLFPYTTLFRSRLVVGSQARILYADAAGRIMIASAFNDAIASGIISGPIVIGRDHHDVSGTDSPFREDRKSTRLNSSHVKISYAVFCLKKNKII